MSYAKAGAADSEMVWMGSVSLATGRTKSARSGAKGRKQKEFATIHIDLKDNTTVEERGPPLVAARDSSKWPFSHNVTGSLGGFHAMESAQNRDYTHL